MLDLRLALPAVAAWAGGAGAIALPDGAWFACALWAVAVASAGAAVVLRAAAEPAKGHRVKATAVVAAVCVAMLLWSQLWLARFHYGPMEWLWRSLARGQLQPLRKTANASQ